MKLYGRVAILLLIAVAANACSTARPIYQLENQPITQLSPPLTLEQIEARILSAGKMETSRDANWRLQAVGPGKIQGLLTIRQRHSANVTIDYDQRAYSIRYKSSHLLRAGKAANDEPFEGQFVIHHKYNSNVRELARLINQDLLFPSR